MAPKPAPQATAKPSRRAALTAQAKIREVHADEAHGPDIYLEYYIKNQPKTGTKTAVDVSDLVSSSSRSDSEAAPAGNCSNDGSSSDGGHSRPEQLLVKTEPGAGKEAAPATSEEPALSSGLLLLAKAAAEATPRPPQAATKEDPAAAGPSKAAPKQRNKAPTAVAVSAASGSGSQHLRRQRPHAVLRARGEQMDLVLLEKRAQLGLQIKAGLDANPASRAVFTGGCSTTLLNTVLGMPAMVGKVVVYTSAALAGTPGPHHEATIVEGGLLRCSQPGCEFQGTRGQYEKHLGSKKANAPKYTYLKEEQINLQDLVSYAAFPDLYMVKCVYCKKDNEDAAPSPAAAAAGVATACEGLMACDTCPCVFHRSCYKKANRVTHHTEGMDDDDWQCVSCRHARECSSEGCHWCEHLKPHEGNITMTGLLQDLHQRLTADPPGGLPIGSLSQVTAPAQAGLPAGGIDAPASDTGNQLPPAEEQRPGAGTVPVTATHTPNSHPAVPSAGRQPPAVAELQQATIELNLAGLSSHGCQLPRLNDLEGDLGDKLGLAEAALLDVLDCIDAPGMVIAGARQGIANVRGGSQKMQDDFQRNYTAVRLWVRQCARPGLSASDRLAAEMHFKTDLLKLLAQMAFEPQ